MPFRRSPGRVRSTVHPVGVAALIVSAATPLTVLAGVVPAGAAFTGQTAFPLMFLVLAVVYALCYVGYLAVARRLTIDAAEGGLYAVIAHGLGRLPSIVAGTVTAVTYTALTVGLYGLISEAVSPLTGSAGLPWQLVAVPAIALIGVLGMTAFRVRAGVLTALAVAELAVVLIVTVGNLTAPAPGGAAVAAAFDPHVLGGAGLGVIALIFLAYTGSEFAPVYSSRVRGGHRGVIIATYLGLGALAVLFVTASTSLLVAVGPDRFLTAATDGDLFFTVAQRSVGEVVTTIARLVFVTSVLAGALAFHGTVVEYTRRLGADGILPGGLAGTGTVSRRRVPASLTQTVIALAAVLVVSVSGIDQPQLSLFYVSGTAGALGVVVLLAMASVSALRLFVAPPSTWEPITPGRRGLLVATSLISSILVIALLVVVLVHLGDVLGVEPGSPLPGSVIGVYLVVVALGVGRSLWARRRGVSARR